MLDHSSRRVRVRKRSFLAKGASFLDRKFCCWASPYKRKIDFSFDSVPVAVRAVVLSSLDLLFVRCLRFFGFCLWKNV